MTCIGLYGKHQVNLSLSLILRVLLAPILIRVMKAHQVISEEKKSMLYRRIPVEKRGELSRLFQYFSMRGNAEVGVTAR